LSADCTIAARVTAPPTMFTLESGETSARRASSSAGIAGSCASGGSGPGGGGLHGPTLRISG
jgi:hypothetical protein